MTTHENPNPWPVRALFLAAALLAPSVAQAHLGAGPTHGLTHGFAHPLTGLDHMAAMVAVGLWAAQRGGRALWLVPLTFVSVMAVGGVLGVTGVPLPLVEPGILASVLVLGVLVAAAVRLPLVASAALVGVFALLHGHAHGTEMPATAAGLAYGAGFVAATALLHAVGIGFGLLASRLAGARLVRYAGAATVAVGLFLCFT